MTNLTVNVTGTADAASEARATTDLIRDIIGGDFEAEAPLPVLTEMFADRIESQTTDKLKRSLLTKKLAELQAAKQTVAASINAGEAADKTLDKLYAIPHPTIRKIVKVAETSAEASVKVLAQIYDAILLMEKNLKLVAKTVDGIEEARELAGRVKVAIDFAKVAASTEADTFEEIADTLERDLSGSVLDLPPEATTQTPQLIDIDLKPALNVFEDRIVKRQDQWQDLKDVLDGLGDLIDDLGLGSVADLAAAIGQKISDYFDLAGDALDLIPDIDLSDLSGLIKPLQSGTKVLNAVQKAIQPILDFFGPVTRFINNAVESVEKALGLDKLEARIRDAIESAIEDVIGAILDPILDFVQTIVDSINSVINRIVELYEEAYTSLSDLILNPIAKSAERDVLSAEGGDVGGKSILVGTEYDDILRLKLDGRFADDGMGGMANAGDGDDLVIGTELADLITGGLGDDTLRGGDGNDQIIGGAGENSIDGGDGADEIAGGGSADTLNGGDGDDQIGGAGGADKISGDAGNDLIDGGAGADTITGGAGDDTLVGGADADELRDGEGTNVLDGGDGLDLINTTGNATATHFITDATAILEGGSGSDIAQLGDAFGGADAPDAGAYFDAGAGRDRLETENLDLGSHVARFVNFETLAVSAGAGDTSVLKTSALDLAGFDGLELSGEGDLVLELSGGPFDMNALYGPQQAFLFDLSGVARRDNAQDGINAGQDVGLGLQVSSSVLALSVVMTQPTGASFTGLAALGDGLTIFGSDGDDMIIGGGGSDVIRAGLGADTVDGGRSDAGDRFDLDGAVGDVIIGSLADLDGDTIRNLSNRVDRVRIEGSDEFYFDLTVGDGQTTVSVFTNEAAFTAGEAAQSTFTLEGLYPKLRVEGDSYVDDTGATVAYTEIFNNNVPPVAVPEAFETGWHEADGVVFDPFANDFDPDTNADAAAGVVRRQIALPESVALFLRQEVLLANGNTITLNPDEEDDAREAFADIEEPITGQFQTELGNIIEVTSFLNADGQRDYTFEYVAAEQTVALRRFNGDDAIAGTYSMAGKFDVTEDLPFFGRDALSYKVFDLEGELSREVNVSFLIRPEVIGENGEVVGTPTVTVQNWDIDDNVALASFDIGLTEQLGNIGSRRITFQSSANETLTTAVGGNDYFDISANFDNNPGVPVDPSFFGLEGNDVLDGREVSENIQLFGGNGADWVEGGDGNDFLAGGGIDDEIILPATRVATDGTAPATDEANNILLGGAGRNVLTASVDRPGNVGIDNEFTTSRDTTYVLDEAGQDLITGPMNGVGASNSAVSINPETAYGPTAITAAALQDDRIIGFGDDDTVLLPLDFSDWTTRFLGAAIPDPFSINLIPLVVQTDVALVNVTGQESLNGNQLGSRLGYRADQTGTVTNTFGLETLPLETANIVSYAFSVSSPNDPASDPSATEVTLSLDAYSARLMDRTATNFAVVEGRVFVRREFEWDQNDSLIDPGGLFDGDGITFTFKMDGFYRADRFVVDVVEIDNPNSVSIDVGDTAGTQEPEGENGHVLIDNGLWGNGYFGLAITYDSAAPETVADTIVTQRGEAVAFNVFDNDTDADGDELEVYNIFFDSAEDEADLLDGDLTNGELIQETDPNSGLGTGNFTYVGVADEIGTRGFSYIAWDGEFQSEATRVDLVQTGLTPLLGDDLIVLAFDALTLGAEIDIAELLANDFDPDDDDFTITSVTLGGVEIPVIAGKITLDAAVLAVLQSTIDASGQGGDTLPLSYTVTDSDGAGVSAAAQVQLARAAELVLADAAPLSMAEDTDIALDVTQIRAGGFGVLQITAAVATVSGTGVSAGEVTASGDGLVFTPAPDLSGVTALIDVTVEDALGTERTTQFSVEITPVADASEAIIVTGGTPTEVTATEDETATGVLIFVDPDIVDQPVPLEPGPFVSQAGGSFALVPDGAGGFGFTYTPPEDFAGIDQVTINVAPASDPTAIEEVEIAINVAAVDDAPRFAETETEVVVDLGDIQPFDLLSGAFDVDGEIDPDSIEVTVGDPNIASFEIVEVELTVELDEEDGDGTGETEGEEEVEPSLQLRVEGLATGATEIIVTVADEAGNRSDPRVITIEVNDPPVAQDDRVELFEGAVAFLIDAIANDSDSDGTIDYVRDDAGVPIATDPVDIFPVGEDEDVNATDFIKPGLLGTVEWSEADGAFRYTPPSDPELYGLTDVFFYEIEDDNGSVAQGQVLIDLFAAGEVAVRFGTVEDPGSIMAGLAPEVLFLLDDDSKVTGTLAEFDGDELLNFAPGAELAITDVAAMDAVVVATRVLSEAPDDLIASDIDGTPDATSILGTTDFDALSAASVGTTQLQITGPGGSATITLPGAYAGTFAVSAAADGSTLISFIPGTDTAGNQTLDGTDGPDALTGGDFDDVLNGGEGDDTLDGGAGNDVIIGGPGANTLTGGEGADLFLISADGGPDTITDFNPYEGDRIAVTDARFVSDEGAAALDRISLAKIETGWELIGDPNIPDLGTGDLADETLARFALPEPASFEDLLVEVDEDGSVVADLAAQAGGLYAETRAFEIVTGPANGMAELAPDGALSYTPNPDFVGEDTVTARLTVQTAIGPVERLATVSFTVMAQDDAPVADDASFDAVEDTSLTGVVTASDIDGDAIGFVLATGPANGTVVIAADGGFEYTPDADFEGTDGFEFTAQAGELSDIGAVSITVAAVNDAPVAEDDAGFASDGSAFSLEAAMLLANDSDVDGDPLEITDVSGAVGGTAELSGDTVLFTPDDGFSGTASFEYTLSDGDLTDTAMVAIEVTPVVTEPYADFFQGSEGRDILFASRIDEPGVFGAGGSDILIGSKRADALAGGNGGDFIYAGWGHDFVDGGAGNDRITLGWGADTLRFATGSDADLVYDFRIGKDQVLLDVDGIAAFEDLTGLGQQNGRHTVFDFGDGDVLTLRNISLDALGEDAFQFL